MKLWNTWYHLVKPLQHCCSRKHTFYWLITIIIGFTIKFDFLGITSIARGVGLLPNYYTCMLNFFSSSAIDLNRLLMLWIQLIFEKFNGIVTLNGRYLIIADGIKVAKEGRKMPGVKWLHQESESNSKAEYIMGHSLQAVAVVVKGVFNYFAVPITAKIHEGVCFEADDNRTLLDKIFMLLMELNLPGTFYFIADKYYCSGRLMKQLVNKGIHMITMMKKNAVAYYPVTEEKKERGRPKKYGSRVKLFDLFDSNMVFTKATMPGNNQLTIEYGVVKLLWRPLGDFAQFVLVKHPIRGHSIAMSTDLTLEALDIIFSYSLRFKIEVLFKQAIHTIGTFMYRFWLKAMQPIKRESSDQQLQMASTLFKEKVKKKLNAYHLFIQLGLIAQGLLQYLSIYHYRSVWRSFGTWLRTIRDTTLPSEKVVAMSLSRTYIQFLADESKATNFKKFIKKRIAIEQEFSTDFEFRQAA